MNIKRVLSAGMVLSLVVLCGYVFAEETREKLSPKAQAKALVESAEEFFLANGKEKTIAASGGSLRRRESCRNCGTNACSTGGSRC